MGVAKTLRVKASVVPCRGLRECPPGETPSATFPAGGLSKRITGYHCSIYANVSQTRTKGSTHILQAE